MAWPGDSHDWPPNREVFYTIDMAATLRGQGTTVELQYRDRKPDGTAGKSYQLRSTPQLAARSPDPEDRRILSSLHGARAESLYGYASSFETAAARYRLPAGLERMPVEARCRTGRCVLRTTDPDAQPLPLRWDDGPPWRFGLRVDRDKPTQHYVLTGQLLRDDQVPRGRSLKKSLKYFPLLSDNGRVIS